MELETIFELINKNGLAIVLLILILWGGYKLLFPYIQKKLDNSVENEDKLEDCVRQGYFDLVQETKEVNKQIVFELKNINATNKELSETNKELSRTNRKLVESYDRRIEILEDSTEDISKTVDKINTKMDLILK